MVNNSIGNSVTGCIRPETLDRLNVNDGGGQYDSSGGDGGQGNPQGSKCLGYVGQLENQDTFLMLYTAITTMLNS